MKVKGNEEKQSKKGTDSCYSKLWNMAAIRRRLSSAAPSLWESQFFCLGNKHTCSNNSQSCLLSYLLGKAYYRQYVNNPHFPCHGSPLKLCHHRDRLQYPLLINVQDKIVRVHL